MSPVVPIETNMEMLRSMANDRCPILGTRQPKARVAQWALDEITRYRSERADTTLAAKHTGMRISAEGVLGRIRDGNHYEGLNYACGVLLGHMEQMATRFYAGDVKAVDEFLQLYDLDAQRPETKS